MVLKYGKRSQNFVLGHLYRCFVCGSCDFFFLSIKLMLCRPALCGPPSPNEPRPSAASSCLAGGSCLPEVMPPSTFRSQPVSREPLTATWASPAEPAGFQLPRLASPHSAAAAASTSLLPLGTGALAARPRNPAATDLPLRVCLLGNLTYSLGM